MSSEQHFHEAAAALHGAALSARGTRHPAGSLCRISTLPHRDHSAHLPHATDYRPIVGRFLGSRYWGYALTAGM